MSFVLSILQNPLKVEILEREREREYPNNTNEERNQVLTVEIHDYETPSHNIRSC